MHLFILTNLQCTNSTSECRQIACQWHSSYKTIFLLQGQNQNRTDSEIIKSEDLGKRQSAHRQSCASQGFVWSMASTLLLLTGHGGWQTSQSTGDDQWESGEVDVQWCKDIWLLTWGDSKLEKRYLLLVVERFKHATCTSSVRKTLFIPLSVLIPCL